MAASAKKAKVLQHPATLRRAFDAAKIHPALTAWISSAVPADNDIRAALRQIRARSREAAQNDDHMRMFLRLVEANVIGRQGVVIQPKPKRIGGGQDKTATAIIEDEWERQCERGNWDVTGQNSRNGFSRLGVRTVAQDGEVLVRFHAFTKHSSTGFAVELIDSESLDFDYNDILPSGNFVRMGVEMTPFRRPVAYWVFAESPPHSGYRQAQRTRIPADEIEHVFLPEWIWGTRGIPWGVTALRRLKMLGGYEEGAVTAARGASIKSAVYTQREDSTGDGPNGIEDGNGNFVQELTPGGIEIVPPGWDLKTLDWGWPNTDHGDFIKETLRGISCGFGVAYNSFANDLEHVNFSSLRQGALTERDLWMIIQDWWIEWVEKVVYRRWLSFAIRSGVVSRRNGDPYDIDRLPQLAHASYQARRWPWVDPQKDTKSAKEEIALGARSISDVIRERGRDPEEVWTELGSDLARLRKLGLKLDDVLAMLPGDETKIH